jgi:hypothetical protein
LFSFWHLITSPDYSTKKQEIPSFCRIMALEGVRLLDNAFKDVTHLFQSGALLLLKMFMLYVVLPEVIGIIVLAGMLRMRGKILSLMMVGIAILGLYLFVNYGVPEMFKAEFAK